MVAGLKSNIFPCMEIDPIGFCLVPNKTRFIRPITSEMNLLKFVKFYKEIFLVEIFGDGLYLDGKRANLKSAIEHLQRFVRIYNYNKKSLQRRRFPVYI